VLCIGVPFQYTESRILKARLEFLRETYRIKENDFLSFDAMRHAAQCLGRVLRGKDDYGVMVLADRRFQKKRTQLPKWINQGLSDADTNLSTDMAVSSARRFLKTMAQPFRSKDQEGISTWGYEDLMQHQRKIEEERGDEPPPPSANARAANDNRTTTYESDYEDIDQDMMELEGF
jgi:DNA excision repair protein ERCC-2